MAGRRVVFPKTQIDLVKWMIANKEWLISQGVEISYYDGYGEGSFDGYPIVLLEDYFIISEDGTLDGNLSSHKTSQFGNFVISGGWPEKEEEEE